jgi:hypothetical protein
MIPRSRPQQTRDVTLGTLARHSITDPVCLVGIRGYYLDSMGAPGRNDFGIYDDALIIVSSNVHAAFNANTDPSRAGWNAKAGKPMAILKHGVYRYRVGKHGLSKANPYTALVQAAPVTVLRGPGEETGWFGINVHRGSRNSTSSEGCQTVPPEQWPAFIELIQIEMKRANAKTLSYVLTEAESASSGSTGAMASRSA